MDKASMFHDLTDAELREKLAALKQELFNLRFQHATGQLKNPLILPNIKSDIARVMTIIKERDLQLPRNEGKKASGGKK